MSSTQPRIAIIGAGPGGLSLGLLLHRSNVPFTIFELRGKPTEEELAKPSGMLDLHDESGLATMRDCGLYDQFLQLTGECAEAQKVADKDGNILYRDEGEISDRPEISRHALTKLLLSHLPSESIKWHHKLLSATTSTRDGCTETILDFGPQGTQTFELVIGADGAWSRIRRLLTDVKPSFNKMQYITLTMRNITTKYPHLAELVGTGSFSALAFHHGIMSQRGPQDSARIYVYLTINDEQFPTTSGLANLTAEQAKDKLLNDASLLAQWGPLMKELVAVACDEETKDNPGVQLDIRPVYSLPIGNTWEHATGATLIGDAAHLMPPFAGEGVNLAMWDSRLLAQAIIEAYKTSGKDAASFQSAVDSLIKDFEAEMAERAGEKAEETESNKQMLFGTEDAANKFVEFFLAVMPPRPE